MIRAPLLSASRRSREFLPSPIVTTEPIVWSKPEIVAYEPVLMLTDKRRLTCRNNAIKILYDLAKIKILHILSRSKLD